MKLKKIGEGFSIRGKDVEIAGVTSHSKEVGHGFLFVAKRGKTHDGNQYIPDAIAAGAVAVVTDLYNPFLQVPQIIVPDVAAAEPLLAARFYEKPHEKLFLIGVTGTSGKTTTTYMIKHLLGQAGLIGSIECVIGEHRIKSHLTTPDCLTGYKWLREMVKEGLPAAVMEVSSHALLQHRVEGLLFDVVVFTNLSHEHLDYHGTMDNYRKAKERLLCQLKPNGIVIANGDDPTWSTLPNAKLYYRNEFEGFSIPFIGAHNQSNAMAAIHVARRYGIV